MGVGHQTESSLLYFGPRAPTKKPCLKAYVYTRFALNPEGTWILRVDES